MCNPIALVAAGTALAVGGKVVSGVNEAAQYRYQSRIAAQNAALAQKSAQDSLRRGDIAEAQQDRKNAQIMGAQRAALASNGVETDFGSAADLQADSAKIGQEDAATIRENAIRETKGYEINAANYTAQSLSARSQAKSTLINTAFDVGSTILSGSQQASKIRAGAK